MDKIHGVKHKFTYKQRREKIYVCEKDDKDPLHLLRPPDTQEAGNGLPDCQFISGVATTWLIFKDILYTRLCTK